MSAPIAIVGQACVLPGALDVSTFADNVFAGRDLVTDAPVGRWGLPHADVMGEGRDRAWSSAGGYVTGFDAVWDPTGFDLPAAELAGLDPLVHWLAHVGRGALRDAGIDVGTATSRARLARCGAVFGNLSFPSEGMARWGERVVLQENRRRAPPADPRDRFMSGLPADLLSRALGLGAPCFAIDAACASSLYAIRLACDALTAGRADIMLAGAVQRADSLFLHIGFCALGAMSHLGMSRPFHREADGLVPAEGAALVVLKRLADAVRDGDKILGVIRGVGLSNDARARNLLAPSEEGQVRALRAAYTTSGVTPADIQLMECHATGTPTGDRTEIATLSEVFGRQPLPIGSLKSMVGHLITAAGVAGLQKVLAGFARQTMPPTLHADEPIPAMVEWANFRLLSKPEPWDAPVRRAAVSAFGFGGNNAHLIVEEHVPGAPVTVATARKRSRRKSDAAPDVTPVDAALRGPPPKIGIVGIAVAAGAGDDRAAFARDLYAGTGTPRRDSVKLGLAGLRFPPKDLGLSLPQQTLLLRVALDAVAEAEVPLPRESTGIYVGMGADVAVSGYGLRWRIGARTGATGAVLESLRDAVIPALRAENVVGTMPNIPANRLNVQLDAGGPGFTLSAEELSGVHALGAAMDALASGSLQVALVGAVDLACDPRHAAAIEALAPGTVPGDAAVALVLVRLDDALAAGHQVWAVLESVETTGAASPALSDASNERGGEPIVAPKALGRAHAAAGLVDIAAAVLACGHGLLPGVGGAPREWSPEGGLRRATVAVRSLGGATARVTLSATGAPIPLDDAPAPLAGHLLSFPAHAEPIVLPSDPSIPKEARAVLKMPTAPTLAPILGAFEAPVAPPVAAPAKAAAPAPAPTKAPAPVAPVTSAPPVTTVATIAAPAPAPLLVAPPAPVAPIPSQPAPSFAAQGGDPTLTALLAQQARVTQVHRAFLEQQAAVQARFAASRAATTQMMLGAAFGGAPPAPMPLPHAPQAALPQAAPIARPAPAPSSPVPAPVAAPIAAPVATVVPRAATPATSARPGPKLSRQDLEAMSRGPISRHFGPTFAPQDAYARVVRMPEPPLLLCDRVTGIDGPPAVLGKGTIWTETDITEESWYLHERHIPAGVMIEAGQADLLLVSWQGVDLNYNRGERMYRLLGCDLRYEGGLPTVGDTLKYEIQVDGHAKLGDIRMFFFHYDCKVGDNVRLTVKEGQAGFFSQADLDKSGGVLWDAATAEVDLTGPVAPPAVACTKSSFSKEDLLAFTEGRVADAFGPGFERAHTHTWTPKIAGGRMLFFDRVTKFDPAGGPWKRGYLAAECDITGNNWFFDGHFHNDPCMPGTLMFEGCLQALQVYMTGLGHTLKRDGWRFEPKQGETFHLRCRGQVIPTSKLLTYEIFVQEVGLDPVPYVKAQVMCTVDALKCFHADPLTLVMVPDWPLTRMPKLLSDYVEPKPAVWDYASLLACAWGQPSHAFGPMYKVFDGTRAVARLPGPPYHFMSRVTRTDGAIGSTKAGTIIEIEYDVPPRDWYFRENGTPTMPFAVLLEAALQPCGWLASYVGSATTSDTDLLFRNLDGTGKLLAEILPNSGTLTTRVKINSVNRSAGMIIEGFDVTMFMADASGVQQPLYEMKTVFGFFPPAAFENQVGVGSEEDDRAWLASPSEFQVDLATHPARYFDGKLRMPGDMLCMIDRVTGHWPTAGKAGLGKWRADKDVDPKEWFFKAHFYMDPVQPGSLGIEAMIQLLQFVMIHEGFGKKFQEPRFEPIAIGSELKWKYRGQVVPRNKLIQTEVEITKVEGDTVTCDAHLWVDGKRIYSAWGLGMRVVEGAGGPTFPFDGPGGATPTPGASSGVGSPGAGGSAPRNAPQATTTVTVPVPIDHCPTYVLPALPAMTMVMLALQATGAPALKDASVTRWLSFPEGPRDVTATVVGDKVVLGAPEPFFVATACAPVAPVELPPLRDAVPGPMGAELYASGELFHGPSFHVVERMVARGSNGATLMLRPAAPDVLLDGITHGVPHDRLETWCPEIAPGQVGYPSRIESISLYGAPPRTDGTGRPVRCEVRFLGLVSGRPRIGAHLYTETPQGEALLASVVIQEVLLPKGRIGEASPSARRDFLLGKAGTGVALSHITGDTARLTARDVKGSDWLPGTIARVFGTTDAPVIAVKEIAAAQLGLHPRDVAVVGTRAFSPHRPLTTVSWAPVAGADPTGSGGAQAGPVAFPDMSQVTGWWRAHLGRGLGDAGAWPGEELVAALARRYLADLVVHDPVAMESVRGRPVLFLGNHENYLESVIFTCVAPALFGTPTRALAKVEHRDRWLGALERLLTTYPGQEQDPFIVWFDQKDPASLPALARGATDRSLLVHVEGTRQITPGQPVDKISSLWVDIALERGLPIVPVAFRGGVDGVSRHDVPAAPQVHHIGAPILPEALAAIPYADRRRVVADAINTLGVPATIAPVTTPIAPGAGIRAALGSVSDGVLRDLLDGKPLPGGAEGAWLAELQGLIA
ncbi:MAG: beta-ketoacyl synthase N-terminal-like domain-containing protein [Myxococcota bacterium]